MVFAQSGAFTCGPLGWFAQRLAGRGLVALAAATSPAVMAASPGTGRVFGTNPLAFAVPRADRAPIAFDQASSAAATVAVRERAGPGLDLPPGWALDAEGAPTIEPAAALAGSLLPFGGYKGANIALLVELLCALAGGTWSIDAAPWDCDDRPPRVGMFVLAVDPAGLRPEFPRLVEEFTDRLAATGARVPGARTSPERSAVVEVRSDVVAALRQRCAAGST